MNNEELEGGEGESRRLGTEPPKCTVAAVSVLPADGISPGLAPSAGLTRPRWQLVPVLTKQGGGEWQRG